MKRFLFMAMALVSFALPSQAQWVVTDPTNLAQGIVNSTKQIIQTSSTETSVAYTADCVPPSPIHTSL